MPQYQERPTKDGRSWYYSIYKRDADGITRKHKSKKFSTKKEAKEFGLIDEII